MNDDSRIASATQEPVRLYIVVRNHEEQYSVWPSDRALPLGWLPATSPADRQDCLSYIRQVWTDLRPKSLRDRMANGG